MTSQTHIKDLKGVMHSDMSQKKIICPMHQALVSEERHSKKYRAEEKSAFFLSCRETDQMSKSTVCYLCLL